VWLIGRRFGELIAALVHFFRPFGLTAAVLALRVFRRRFALGASVAWRLPRLAGLLRVLLLRSFVLLLFSLVHLVAPFCASPVVNGRY